ncbi:MAG: DsbA family protein [Gemmobacter sp.]
MKQKLGLAAVALALVAGVALWSAQRPAAPGQSLLPGLVSEAQAQDQGTLPEVADMSLGDPAAKVKMIEYASFTCPHCATFHANVLTPLKADYIDTGKVHFTLREVYFDRYGLWAGMVARCGGEDRYFGIAGVLFDTLGTWAGSSDPATVVQNLRRIGKVAGVDDAQLDSCLNDGQMAQAMVNRFQETTAADDVQGTPTLIINGKKHANMSYADLRVILDAELAK